MGEPGNYGTYGRNREVFYSNGGARRVAELIETAGKEIRADLEEIAKNPAVMAAAQHKAIARRLETLIDLVETP